MRIPMVLLSALWLSVLAGCVNTDTGATPTADSNPEAIGAGEAPDANTQAPHR